MPLNTSTLRGTGIWCAYNLSRIHWDRDSVHVGTLICRKTSKTGGKARNMALISSLAEHLLLLLHEGDRDKWSLRILAFVFLNHDPKVRKPNRIGISKVRALKKQGVISDLPKAAEPPWVLKTCSGKKKTVWLP